MIITSLKFFSLLFPLLALYYFLPRRLQNYLLLAVSYVFYAIWAWQFPIILFILTALNYKAAQRLRKGDRVVKPVLWGGVALNIAALVVFKYADFFVPQMRALVGGLGVEAFSGTLKILLPVGLSYRVLENISYLLDVYRGQIPASEDPVDFALYTAYFPKLLSGPIERARAFLPLLARQRIVDNETLKESFTLIMLGAVRKLVIADTIASITPPGVFEDPLKYSALALASWLSAYVFMVYNDFAGYTNIVQGVSGLFGIKLSRNFLTPLLSRSFAELWTRWHITLSFWLRDYIYLPLSRALLRRGYSPRGALMLIIPPLAAMVVSGLWHELRLHMVLWGILSGIYLAGGNIISRNRMIVPPDKLPVWRQGMGMVMVFTLTALSLVVFRMNLATAAAFYRGLLIWERWDMPDLRIFFLIGISLTIDVFQYRGRDEVVFTRWQTFPRSVALAVAVFAIFLATRTRAAAPFIYQGF